MHRRAGFRVGWLFRRTSLVDLPVKYGVEGTGSSVGQGSGQGLVRAREIRQVSRNSSTISNLRQYCLSVVRVVRAFADFLALYFFYLFLYCVSNSAFALTTLTTLLIARIFQCLVRTLP